MFFAKEIFIQKVTEEMVDVLDYIRDVVREEFIAQGHHMTGALEDTIRNEVLVLGRKVVGIMWINDYYKYVDQGVSADRIPFGGTAAPGQGSGQKSKYIQALVEYVHLKMGIADEKQALGVAFAIAHKHKKEGMPTKSSSAFSNTGKRTGFFTQALKDSEAEIIEGFGVVFDKAIDAVIDIFNSQVRGSVKIVL
jgi:hypothetical protein